MTQDEIKASVAAWAAEKPLILEVVLFGSRARGDHRDDSDVDLALRCAAERNRKPLGTFIENAETWKAQLAGLLRLPVDLEPLDVKLELIGDNLARDGLTMFKREEPTGKAAAE